MDIEEFKKKILYEIENNKKECLKTLEENENLVQLYLTSSEKCNHLNEFVTKFNEIIIKQTKEFDLIENIIKHPLFFDVLSYFRKSDILIKACINKNIKALEWLLTMDINWDVQDDKGMTALMHAASNKDLFFVIERFIPFDNKTNEIMDMNGETALFHGASNNEIFKRLIRKNMNINHCRKNGDSLLIYCSKNNYIDDLTFLIALPNINVNYVNEEGKTIMFYLFENEQFDQFRELLQLHKGFVDTNYVTKDGETILYPFFRKYYEYWVNNNISFVTNLKNYKWITSLDDLINAGCDFNGCIDDKNNTPIMYFLMTDNIAGLDYYLNKVTVDLYKKNVYGINATYLIATKATDFDNMYKKYNIEYDKALNPYSLIVKHPSFDYKFQDKNHNTLLMHLIIRNALSYYLVVLNKVCENEKIMYTTNNNGETALIIAVKLGRKEFLHKELITHSPIDYQDKKGNTALHYAVELKDKYAINFLSYYHANIKIENNEGISPLDLAKKINDEEESTSIDDLIKILKSPIIPYKMLKQDKPLKIFNKKKTTDEKVDDYIKKYKNNCYYDEYKSSVIYNDTDLLETEYSYQKKSDFNEKVIMTCRHVYYPQ